MISSSDFNVIYVKNSTTEFVIVARERSGYVPVIASENCSLELMGFSSSRENLSVKDRDFGKFKAHMIASDIEEYNEIGVEFSNSQVFFYWKGAMPVNKDQFLHSLKNGVSQIFREKNNWENLSQDFFSWNIGPVIFQIEQGNEYKKVKNNKFIENRDRSYRLFNYVAIVGVIAAALAASEFTETIASYIRYLLS